MFFAHSEGKVIVSSPLSLSDFDTKLLSSLISLLTIRTASRAVEKNPFLDLEIRTIFWLVNVRMSLLHVR